MNLYPVISAGYSGTRFWPVRRRETPKQLVNLIAERSLIRQTVDHFGNTAIVACLGVDQLAVIHGGRNTCLSA